MVRRRGMSMAEVLVALFLLALGTIAILTMFPLGMYHMGQALKDDRTAQASNQANAFMRWYWRENMVEAAIPDVNFQAFSDPNSNGPPAAYARAGLLPIPQGSPEPSYPLCIDPMGYGTHWGALNTPSTQYWVADQLTPRRALARVPHGPYAQKVCSVLDGFGFDADGSAPNTNGNPFGGVERELRYNWLWVLQRPQNSDRNTATIKVVVFDNRPFQFAAQNAERAVTTLAPAASGGISNVPGSTVLSFPAGTQLGVGKGRWIADVTTLNHQYAPGQLTPWVRNCNFYRIVSVTETASSVEVELQEPLRADTQSRLDPNGVQMPSLPATQSRTFVVLAGASEVFEAPMLTR